MSMDYLTLNALAITALAIFGLWAFQRGARKQKDADRERRNKKNRT